MNVIFDLGKVLIDYDFDLFFSALDCKSDSNIISAAHEILDLFDAGKISRRNFYASMRNFFGFKADQVTFETLWCNIFSPLPQMLELAENISRKHNVFILSNTDEIHFPYLWQQYPQLHFFGKNLMLSFLLGSVKPHPEIYRKGLRLFNLAPEDCLFIDDKTANVESARRCGLKAFLHRSYLETEQNLSKYLTEKNDKNICLT